MHRVQDSRDMELLWSAVLAERPRAERIARARCATPQDAEDCVQEAIARVAAMPHVDRARVGPLLATVTAHLAVDSHRGRVRAFNGESRLRSALMLEETPEESVCDAAEARWLWQRMDSLAAQDRRVLELRAQGRTAPETAATLGLTYKAVESSYTRARKKMRAIWRATAAGLGILWGRPTRRPAEAAVLATAAFALTFVLLPDVQGEAAVPPLPAQTAAPKLGAPSRSAPDPAEKPRVAARRDVTPAAVPGASLNHATGTGPASARPLVRAEPITARRTTTSGVTVSREREEETFAQAVERCLREGIEISPYHVECRG